MTYLFRKKNETILGTGNSPLAGGRVHYYIAGTTTRLDTYADQAGNTINDNPITLNGDGDFPVSVYLGEANDYKEVIEAADRSFSTTIDNIPKAETAATTLLVQSPSFVWTTVSALRTILDEAQVGKAFAANTKNNNVTFLLPNPALSQNGPTLVFKKINASNSLILQDHLGGAFLTIDNGGDSVFLSSNGAEWHVVSDLNSSQGGAIDDDEVTNVKLANVGSGTFKGRMTAGVGDPEDLGPAAATSLLNEFSPDNDVDTAGVKGLVPAPGIGDASAGKILSADGTWIDPPSGGGGSTALNPADGDLVGVNATADTTNRLSVSSPATLFNHEGNGHQHKINKNSTADTASVLFQTNFSGRAEFGLTGDDDFHMKVSPDGATFYEGIVIDKDTGFVSIGSNSIQNVTLHVLRDADSSSYQNVMWASVGNNAGASNYTRYSFFQTSTNNMGMEVADQSNTKGKLSLQPYGGTVSIGSASTIVDFPGIGTTANAANAFLDSSNSNRLLRSTSSVKYKKDIEPLDVKYSKSLIDLQPIWYRSNVETDNQEWSWYGFSAEEVAEIDPRMVAWGYGPNDYDKVEIDRGDEIEEVGYKLKPNVKKSPQGVLYERFVVHHQLLIKDLLKRIEILENKKS